MSGDTRYAKSGDVHIAYQVLGRGAVDLVFVPGFASHVEHIWEDPVSARSLERLASFSRLILFDKRGTGLSDRASPIFTLEQRMDDVRAVLDTVGSQRAVLFGVSEGGPMSILFAATYPERTTALILYGAYARRSWAPDYPFFPQDPAWEAFLQRLERDWGGPVGIDVFAPTGASDERFRAWWAGYLRLGASPSAASAVMRMNREIDVRHVLPTVQAPTLILHRGGDRNIGIDNARYMAQRIPEARFVELSGNDHWPWIGNVDAILDEIEEFLTGVRRGPEPDRVLATVLFTDLVEATRKAAELGDRRWGDLLTAHHALVRRELVKFRGREIDTAGDGFLAVFDGPARAVRAASAISRGVRGLGLEVRAGIHTGECEMLGDKLGGIAVHIGARIAALAQGGEVLVSSTVKDLVAGSGLRFRERGVHVLKGVPDDWRLFAADEVDL